MTFHDFGGRLGLPDHIEIEPTNSCNLRCRMCHVSYMPVESRPLLSVDLVRKLTPLKGKWVHIGSGFEPTMHPDFPALIKSLTDIGSRIDVVTNGVLLSGDNCRALQDSDLGIVQFSFDGIRKESYESIRRGADYDQVMSNMLAFRQSMTARDTMFAVNATILRSIIDEIGEIVRFWDAQSIDLVRLIAVVVRDLNSDLIRECLYPVRDRFYAALDSAAEDIIVNNRRIAAFNPYYKKTGLREKYASNFIGEHVRSDNACTREIPRLRQQYQLGAFPGMDFDCKSPFTFARILNNGDVQLCTAYTVGNLADGSFEDIWFGARANEVRLRLMADRTDCTRCDYYRFCLQSHAIEVDDPLNHFTKELVGGLDKINFDTGEVSVSISPRPPRLVETLGRNNIVEYDSTYYVMPQSLGPIDLATTDVKSLPGVMVATTLRRARQAAAR